MERSREARRPTMAATNGVPRLRERPNRGRMIEQSKKQRRSKGDEEYQDTTEEESLSFYDEKSPPLKAAHEMIGVAVPRKARSASGKRSHEYASSGSYGGVVGEEEQSLQKLSVKAASLSFSNVSSRKKMKPNKPKKSRPPNLSSKSSGPVDEDIEIEIAEVLYGFKNCTSNLEAKDINGNGSENGAMEKKVELGQALMAVEVESEDQPEKIETFSPKSSGGSEGASGSSMESHEEDAKPLMEDSTGTKVISTGSVLKSKKEERFEFDLMAPPPMERDDSDDFVCNPKPLARDLEMKMEISVKNEQKAERFVEEVVPERMGEKKKETSMEKLNENPNQDSGSKLQHQPKPTAPKLEKIAHSSSVPLGSSTTLQPATALPSQLRPKRCATHRCIAHNIYLHQQVAKMNNFQPAATGPAPLCGAKPDILKAMFPAGNIVIGKPLLGSFPGPNLQNAHEKEQAVSKFPSHSGKDKSSEATSFLETSQRKHLVVQQAPQPTSAGTQMQGHNFMFPLDQHQAPVTPTSNQSGPLKYAKSTNKASLSSHSVARPRGSSSALPTVASVKFNNPNMTAKEGPYLAINGYPFPISTHIGTTPAFQGGNPAQAVPLFNGPFHSNQMYHSSLVQQQQPHLQVEHQGQPTHKNTSALNDSLPSHKQLESQQRRETQFSSSNCLTSTSMQVQQSKKQYVPPSVQSCKLEGEMNGEDTASPAASHAQKSVYGQNFAVPFQPLNFTLMPYVTMSSGGSGNHIEQSQQQGLKGGVDLIPSKAYGMSFASFGGNSGTGSCLNFSSMGQNQPIFQSLPDMAHQGYKVAPAPQAAQQKNHHHQISERKSGSGSKTPDDGLKAASGKSSSSIGHRQTLVFDNSAGTLNFMSSPITGNWPPRSIPLTTMTTNAPVDGNTSSNFQQQHLFQFQLQKPHMLQQHQPAISAKVPKNSPTFSQGLIQCNSSVQSPQLKNSTVMIFPQQQGRASQGQTQISFGGNPKSSLVPQGQQRLTNNHSSTSLVACSSSSTLQSQQTENSASGNGQMSSPACGRNLPSILSTCPSNISELKY